MAFNTVNSNPKSSADLSAVKTQDAKAAARIDALELKGAAARETLQQTIAELITVKKILLVSALEINGRTGALTFVTESTRLAIVVMDTAVQVTQAINTAASRFQISKPTANFLSLKATPALRPCAAQPCG